MRGTQIIMHIARMTGHVTQPFQTRDMCEVAKQPRETPRLSVRTAAAIGVDVLAKQRDFAHALADESPCFLGDLLDGARKLRPARVRHHAERAEFVASF